MLRNPEKTKDAVIVWLREYFEQYAPEACAVVGISGGKDSSVAAAFCAAALGKDRVIGVALPDGSQADIADSYALMKHLGLPKREINIQGVTEGFVNAFEASGTAFRSLSGQAKINMPARIRMAALYAVAQTLPSGGLVINTCNRSEDYVGYSTKFGDAAGDISPLAGFTVREVLQLGKVLSLPEQLLTKEPSDGLSGMTDEVKLGFSYAALDDYLETGRCWDAAVKAKIDTLHQKNLHKLQPMPTYHKTEFD